MENISCGLGDSLNSIARAYGIPLGSLIQANPQIADPNQLNGYHQHGNVRTIRGGSPGLSTF